MFPHSGNSQQRNWMGKSGRNLSSQSLDQSQPLRSEELSTNSIRSAFEQKQHSWTKSGSKATVRKAMFPKVMLMLTWQENMFHAGSRGCHIIQRLELSMGREQDNRSPRETWNRSHKRKVRPGELTWEHSDLGMIIAHDLQIRVKGTWDLKGVITGLDKRAQLL